jgi:hypothetical protein
MLYSKTSEHFWFAPYSDGDYLSYSNKRCANDVGHLHHIQARQQCVVLQVESVDRNPGIDMALSNQNRLIDEQCMFHLCDLLYSHP